jgi:hypothetical protein
MGWNDYFEMPRPLRGTQELLAPTCPVRLFIRPILMPARR